MYNSFIKNCPDIERLIKKGDNNFANNIFHIHLKLNIAENGNLKY